MHEVVVVAEHLDRGAEDVFETLVHEAAHAMNFERGIRDCSASQYHNRHFHTSAEELGLEVTQIPHYGFALTKLLPITTTRYAEVIAHLDSVLIHRRAPVLPTVPTGPTTGKDTDNTTKGGTTKGGRNLKATCACEPPFIIRVSRKTLLQTTIICGRCRAAFLFRRATGR